MKTIRIISFVLLLAAVTMIGAIYYQEHLQVKVLHSETSSTNTSIIETKDGEMIMLVEEHHSVRTPYTEPQQQPPGILH